MDDSFIVQNVYRLDLSKYFIHDPIGSCGTFAVTGTSRFSKKMVYHGLNQRLLHVFGVFYNYFFTSSFGVKGNRVIGEYGETDHAIITDNLNAVFASRIMGNEAP